MGHEIHHDDFKVTTSKERILAMVSARAERDGDYHEPITSMQFIRTVLIKMVSGVLVQLFCKKLPSDLIRFRSFLFTAKIQMESAILPEKSMGCWKLCVCCLR